MRPPRSTQRRNAEDEHKTSTRPRCYVCGGVGARRGADDDPADVFLTAAGALGDLVEDPADGVFRALSARSSDFAAASSLARRAASAAAASARAVSAATCVDQI